MAELDESVDVAEKILQVTQYLRGVEDYDAVTYRELRTSVVAVCCTLKNRMKIWPGKARKMPQCHNGNNPSPLSLLRLLVTMGSSNGGFFPTLHLNPFFLLLLLLLLLCCLRPVQPATRPHQIQIDVGNKQHRQLSFTNTNDPTITAHRFCAKHGILDVPCSHIATNVARVQAKANAHRPGLHVHIAQPAQGAQIQIPSTYAFHLTSFQSPQNLSNVTTCLVLTSVFSAGTETTTTQCMDSAALPSTFPVTFERAGYHLATFQVTANSITTTTSVAFTSVSAQDVSAVFFDAFCDAIKPGQPLPHPMTRRPMAMLDQELMFRSTGTSNPGHNFPKFWLPSSGLAPEWFLNVFSPVTSYRDINERKIDTAKGTVAHVDRGSTDHDHGARMNLYANALTVFSMIDKRFALGSLYYFCTLGKNRSLDSTGTMHRYNATLCKDAVAWVAQKKRLALDWRESNLVDEVLAVQSGSGDTLRAEKGGNYVLDRFYSIRTLVVSIRLGSCAWRANGYWKAALHVLDIAAAMGIQTRPVLREDRRDQVLAGICNVNQFIHHDLGFNIDGWELFYQNACLTTGGKEEGDRNEL